MRSSIAILLFLLLSTQSIADSGVGPNGIDAENLKLPNETVLTGAEVGIGQVEGGRPGKPIANGGPDDPANSASSIVPAQVYMGTSIANTNGFRVLSHPQNVASVIVSTDTSAIGVAPGASLHAGGYAATGDLSERRIALAMNHIATRNGGDISAINFSEGIGFEGFETTDGSSHLTHFVDWSAAQHDVLYVVGGTEEFSGQGPLPSDNYNGITVAVSSNFMSDTFDLTWAGNRYDEDALGDRVSVDLIAPGTSIDVVNLGGNLADPPVDGTSFAAPHVTGAVALLQQYAKYQIDNTLQGWVNPNARRHEVMKAILLNSADKLAGVHNIPIGLFLTKMP